MKIKNLTNDQQMRTAVTQWVEMPDSQWHNLRSIFHLKRLPDRAYAALPGTTTHDLVFVCEGLLRFYYVSDDETETNKAFIAENDFASPLAASALNLPIYYGIQTLEPTTMLVARYTDFAALFEQHPIFDRLGRKMAERLLIRKELRTRSLLQQKAKERYLTFKQQYPNLIKRIPQYHIASYLGITEVTLSRLKREPISEFEN